MNSLIIIPAYNVEKGIPLLMHDLEIWKDNIVFIDDGSTDATHEKLNDAKFQVIKHEENIGTSGAILSGLKFASRKGYHKVIIMDADGQHEAKYLEEIDQRLDEYDFVFCSRFHRETIAPDVKWNANLFAASFVNYLWGTKYTDVSCGFKGFHLDKRLLCHLERSKNYELIFELFFYALTGKYSIGTIPIKAIYNYSEFLSTKRVEILSFIQSLKRNIGCIIIDELYCEVNSKEDFILKIQELEFRGFYINDTDSYLIQCDKESLKQYLNMIIGK